MTKNLPSFNNIWPKVRPVLQWVIPIAIILLHLYFRHTVTRILFFGYLIWGWSLLREKPAALEVPEADIPTQDEEKIDLSAYYRTSGLSSLNPITLVQSLFQLYGESRIRKRYRATGLPSAQNFSQTLAYQLPIDPADGWAIGSGGHSPEESHSWEVLTQRYAYDFIAVDEEGKSYRNEGKQLTDYYCYGKPLLSPAAGKIVRVNDGVRDYPGVGDFSIDWKTRDFRGNFVVIQHAEQQYSFLAHLQAHRIPVKVGDQVEAGQVVGYCGNSGHSTEPHLHFHLQDHPNMWYGAGLPIWLAGIEDLKRVA
ncbi:MAG: M23 family metallopeptidase [Bacteroidota bacterium]